MAARDATASLQAIHALMDGKEWNTDTLQNIAHVLTGAGFRIREPNEGEARYACPECGSNEVELCFPVWVRANEMDNRELWDLDAEASPEKDGDKGTFLADDSRRVTSPVATSLHHAVKAPPRSLRC